MKDFLTESIDFFDQQIPYGDMQILSASIVILQTTIGRHFRSGTIGGRSLNGFFIGIGAPATNKTIMTKQIEQIANELKINFPNSTTPEALVKYIGDQDGDPHPEGIMIYDEIGRLFQSKSYMDNIFRILSMLWSSQAFLDNTIKRGINGFNAGTSICLMGLGTEDVLRHLQPYHFTQGFGRRPFWYTIESQTRPLKESDFFDINSKQYKYPRSMMEFLHFFRLMPKEGLITLSFSIEAKSLYLKYVNELKTKKEKVMKYKKYHALWLASSPEHLSMFAATKRISRLYNPKYKRDDYPNMYAEKYTSQNKHMCIEEQDVEWAYKIHELYYNGFCDVIELWLMQHTVDKKIENWQPMIDKIEAHINRIISANLAFSKKAVKKETGLSTKEFDDAFVMMIERGMIKINASGARTRYYYVPLEDREEKEDED